MFCVFSSTLLLHFQGLLLLILVSFCVFVTPGACFGGGFVTFPRLPVTFRALIVQNVLALHL